MKAQKVTVIKNMGVDVAPLRMLFFRLLLSIACCIAFVALWQDDKALAQSVEGELIVLVHQEASYECAAAGEEVTCVSDFLAWTAPVSALSPYLTETVSGAHVLPAEFFEEGLARGVTLSAREVLLSSCRSQLSSGGCKLHELIEYLDEIRDLQ